MKKFLIAIMAILTLIVPGCGKQEGTETEVMNTAGVEIGETEPVMPEADTSGTDVPETSEEPVPVPVLTLDRQEIEAGYGMTLIFTDAEPEVPAGNSGETVPEGTEDDKQQETDPAPEYVLITGENVAKWRIDVPGWEARETEAPYTAAGDRITFRLPGSYEVLVTAEGMDGSQVTKTVAVLVKDGTAPVLTVPEKITFTAGEAYDYLEGVSAEDEIDGDVTGSVASDASGVNAGEAGNYTVVYSVTDAAGNVASAEVPVTVKALQAADNSSEKNGSGISADEEREIRNLKEVIDGLWNVRKLDEWWAGAKEIYKDEMSEEAWRIVDEYVQADRDRMNERDIRNYKAVVDRWPFMSIEEYEGWRAKWLDDMSEDALRIVDDYAQAKMASLGNEEEEQISEPSRSEGNEWKLDRSKAEEAFRLQNERRVAAGVSELIWDENIYEIACKRVEEIMDDFSHNGVPENLGENIAHGYDTAEKVIQAWYDSEDHRYNMLLEQYRSGAIANMGGYWVALFSY